MAKNQKINVQDIEIAVITTKEQDYVSLTDVAKSKEGDGRAADIIKNWIRNRGTIEFIGTWEQLHNPGFKVVEFDQFMNEADLSNMSLFGITAREWREENPKLKGNMRDYATINQLVCLSNLESLNAVFIDEGLLQEERIRKLNQIAISQMRILTDDKTAKKLEDK